LQSARDRGKACSAVTRAELSALREKYEEMLRLRLEPGGGDPRRAMAALASQFPGSLREIDELSLETIASRLAQLRASEHGASPAPWMEATSLFHALTRGALCAKKWLAGRKPAEIDDDVRSAFDREVTALCWADDARAWKPHLARLAGPPRGRVTELVYERMGAQLEMSADEARMLVFGEGRSRRRRTES
jgi:hypothetical protein